MELLKPHNLLIIFVAAYVGVWGINKILGQLGMDAYKA